MKIDQKTIVTAAIALIIGFLGGHFISGGTAKTASFPGGGVGFSRGASSGRTMGGGFLSGTVAKQDSGSITVNTRDGSSHVVLLTPDTTVSKSVNGALTDIATGSEVIVSGTTNSDGSVSASLIQLRPAGSSPIAPGTNAPMIPAPQVQ
jgi:hypothetical protein